MCVCERERERETDRQTDVGSAVRLPGLNPDSSYNQAFVTWGTFLNLFVCLGFPFYKMGIISLGCCELGQCASAMLSGPVISSGSSVTKL